MHTQLSDTRNDNLVTKTERGSCFSLFFVLLSLLIIGIYAYSVHFLCGFSLYPDEFGYWSTAAAIVGYDWSQITSLGYYYSFGYSLILAPILAITGGGVVAYRVAIAVNVILQIGSIWLLYGLIKKIWPDDERLKNMFAVAVGVLYPVWIYYMHLTMVEALLAFMYILTCYLAARYMEKPTAGRFAPVFLSLTYMYYLHMRTVSVFIAGIIILVIRAIDIREDLKKKILIVVGILAGAIIAFLLGEHLKSLVMSTAYAQSTARQLGTNDYSGRVASLAELISLKGMVRILRSAISKLMYLGMSSFGMVYVAFIFLFRQTILLFRSVTNKRDIEYSSNYEKLEKDRLIGYTSLFILATSLCQYLLIVIANAPGDEARLDGLPYGRYIEHISPLLIAMGVRALMAMTYKYWIAIGSFVYNAIALTITVGWSVNAGTFNIHDFCIAGISYLWNVWDTDVVGKYLISLLVSTVTMVILYIVVNIVSKSKKHIAVLSATVSVIVLETVLGMHLCNMNVYPSARADELDGRIVRYIEENIKDNEDTKVIYLSEGNPPYVDIVQFGLRNIPIDVLKTRSRCSEIEEINNYDTKINWIPDENNSDYDGEGNIYRMTDASVIDSLAETDKANNLYILADINSTYKDALSERYRCVMDTMWLKLYMPK